MHPKLAYCDIVLYKFSYIKKKNNEQIQHNITQNEGETEQLYELKDVQVMKTSMFHFILSRTLNPFKF